MKRPDCAGSRRCGRLAWKAPNGFSASRSDGTSADGDRAPDAETNGGYVPKCLPPVDDALKPCDWNLIEAVSERMDQNHFPAERQKVCVKALVRRAVLLAGFETILPSYGMAGRRDAEMASFIGAANQFIPSAEYEVNFNAVAIDFANGLCQFRVRQFARAAKTAKQGDAAMDRDAVSGSVAVEELARADGRNLVA